MTDLPRERSPIPVRITVHVLAALTPEEYDAGVHFDRLTDAIEALGYTVDGGSAGVSESVELKEARDG
jgi:hypothetical protein